MLVAGRLGELRNKPLGLVDRGATLRKARDQIGDRWIVTPMFCGVIERGPVQTPATASSGTRTCRHGQSGWLCCCGGCAVAASAKMSEIRARSRLRRIMRSARTSQERDAL